MTFGKRPSTDKNWEEKEISYSADNDHETELEGFIDSTHIRHISKKVSFNQGCTKLVSVVSRILDTKRLVRHYGLKTTQKLRQNCLDTVHLITIWIDIINLDIMGSQTSIRHYEI